MKNKDTKSGISKFLDLKYVLIGAGIILLAFGIFTYFTSNDDNSNDKDSVKEDLTSEVLYTKTEEGLSKIITTNINGTEVSLVCARVDDSGCELKINNKFILNNTSDNVVESIYRVGSIIAILVGESNTDNGFLYLINSDGTVNSVIANRMENSVMFKLSYSSENFKVEGNKISFYMTSVQENRKILVNGNLLIDVINETDKFSQYNITDDTVVASKYEIEYLGNGKFSEMKVIESTTCKELIEDVSNQMPITSQLIYDVRDENKRKFPVTVGINQKSVVIDSHVPEPGALSYLKIDDLITDIILSDGMMSVSSVYVIGDLIAVETMGTDVNSTKVKFYDINGSLVKDITNPVMNGLKFSVGSIMSSDYMSTDLFSISESKIKVIYNSVASHESKLVMEDDTTIEISHEDELAKRGIVDSTPIEVVAEYEYLGDGKFSEMKIVKKYSFKELKDKYN